MAKNINNGKNAPQEIPKLPRGQGSISWIPEREKYLYKKNINGQRKSVLGDTLKDVMENMNRLEKKGGKKVVVQKTITLSESMFEWLETYKKPKLKKTSYDTLKKTICSRIAAYDIGSMRLSVVDSDMIQRHINMLNEEENLSFSTIKKCYDALNDFYRNRMAGGKIEINPMLSVVMINKENVIKETKKIEFFEEDIKRFIRQASLVRK